MADGTCSIPGCDTSGYMTRGWCTMHYGRWRRTGTTDEPIPRTRKMQCALEGCPTGGRMTQGYCARHYYRLRIHGDVGEIETRRVLTEPGQVCSIEGCGGDKPLRRGWCQRHYQRWEKHGNPEWEPPKPREGCLFEDCDKPHASLGYCATHYMRIVRTGTVEDRKPREAAPCVVDGCDRDLDKPQSGMCNVHYLRWRRHGDPTVLLRTRMENPPETCQEDGCSAVHFAAEKCRRHYLAMHHATNRDERNARMRAHYEANREYYYSKTNARRNKLMEIGSEDIYISAGYRKAIYGDRCLYCGAAGEETDHFFPIAKGGTEHWWNLVRACTRCNKSKAAHCGTWFILKTGGGRIAGRPAPVAEAG